ncbi:MAG: Na(+)/H(+) antiporter subunit B [Candidatus Aminicenantes bacterium]|nr:Na(+)/H(+) antiporter subunit B [Candidatus Aminicenantes bacterium]
MRRNENNPIIDLISSLVAPFIMLFGLYVIFHGHYSPGGGFQGGTLLAASVILLRLSLGSELGQSQFPRRLGTPLASLGVLIYYGTGLAALILGGAFLNYGFIPFSALAPLRRSWGILSVEIGVGLAVMAVLVAIYDDLLEGEPDA